MKIIVTGGSGFVGYHLCERLVADGHEVEFTYLSHECAINGARGRKADVSDAAQLACLFPEKYDAIIHSAALANVDLCEKDHALAERQNVQATKNAISLAKKCGAAFAYVSTSHVFPAKNGAYTENDAPSLGLAPNYYGKTKLLGEICAIESGLPYLIFRIDQPYYWKKEWHKDNTVTRTVRKLQKGERIAEVEDWLNCPTFMPSFCELASRLLSRKSSGIFHAAGPEYLSRLQWAREVARAFSFHEEKIEPVLSGSFHLPAARPNVQLDCRKAYRKAGVKNLGVAEALGIMRREWEEKGRPPP